RSVHSQTHPDKEHIVIDGLSTDGTLDIIRQHAEGISTFVSEEDGGIYSALNKGIAKATGDIVCFLHSDGLYFSDRVLEKVDAEFIRTGADAVYGDIFYVDKSNLSKVVRNWNAGEFKSDSLRNGWMPPHPAFFVRRDIYKRLGSFDERVRIAGDADCMLRCLNSGHLKVASLPEPMINMRTGGASGRSLKNILIKSREDYRALKSNQVGGVTALLKKNLRKIPMMLFK